MSLDRLPVQSGSRQTATRRKLLATLGGVGALSLAGCSGDDGGDGSNNNGNSSGNGNGGGNGNGRGNGGGNGGIGQLSCSDLTAGYETYAGRQRPLLFDVDIPSVLTGMAEYQSYSSLVAISAVKPLATDGREQFHLFVSQTTAGTSDPSSAFGQIYDTVAEIEFDGETRPVGKVASAEDPAVEQLITHLPYDTGEGTRYFQAMVQLEIELGDVGDACSAVIDESALDMVRSIRPNSETTLGETSTT